MAYKGFKVEQEGFSLEVLEVKKVTDNVSNIRYVVKKGDKELTDGFIFVTKDQDSRAVLKETLNQIVRAVRRVQIT